MNSVDFDKKKFTSDGYGNLTPKTKTTSYNGYTIDVGIGKVKVWDTSDKFFGEFPDIASAKAAIDNVL